MGLGTAFHLAERGYDVTILEKADSVASVSIISKPDKYSKYIIIRLKLMIPV